MYTNLHEVVHGLRDVYHVILILDMLLCAGRDCKIENFLVGPQYEEAER